MFNSFKKNKVKNKYTLYLTVPFPFSQDILKFFQIFIQEKFNYYSNVDLNYFTVHFQNVSKLPISFSQVSMICSITIQEIGVSSTNPDPTSNQNRQSALINTDVLFATRSNSKDSCSNIVKKPSFLLLPIKFCHKILTFEKDMSTHPDQDIRTAMRC